MTFKHLFLTALLVFAGMRLAEAQKCDAPECRAFDFWTGEWDLTWSGKDGQTVTGKNLVRAILDSCVIEENFTGPDLRGKSVSVFNKRRGIWQQTWVDNNGGYLDFTGGFSGGKMVLSRSADTPQGKRLQRMTWYNIAPDSLDWNWEISADEGATWKLAWHIHYRRKGS